MSYYRLHRINDGLEKVSKNIKWLEFDEQGKYKADFEDIAVGRSLIMSPFNIFFTWQTTTVTEVLGENPIHFKTQNSEYKLYKEEDNDV
ncbi:MAG: hypothetical protein E6R13_00155 [Spirochaetes bacterium]|nr:MAG: hypothetical protein E6R13_00155 [Spirochaetota bacterium]